MRRVLLASVVILLVAAGGLYAYLPGLLSSHSTDTSRSTTSKLTTTTATSMLTTTTTSTSTHTSAPITTTSLASTASISTTTTTTTTTTTADTTTTTTTSTRVRTTTSTATNFYFSGGSAVYLNTSDTKVTVTVVNNGSHVLSPRYIKDKVPKGTHLVPGTWKADYYDPSGNYLCTAPQGAGPTACAGVYQNVADGGHIVVTFLITGATVGEDLTLSYTAYYVTETIHLTVTG